MRRCVSEVRQFQEEEALPLQNRFAVLADDAQQVPDCDTVDASSQLLLAPAQDQHKHQSLLPAMQRPASVASTVKLEVARSASATVKAPRSGRPD